MKFKWFLWLIPVYVVAFLAMAPASLISWGVSYFGGINAPKLVQMEGSLWQGRIGTLQVVTRFGTQLELQQIDYQINPWALLIGRLDMQLQVAELPANLIDGTVAIDARRGGIDGLSGVLRGDVGRAIVELNLPVPVPMQGQFRLDLAHYAYNDFSVRHWCDALQGTLQVSAAQVQLNNIWSALGDYQTQLACNERNGIGFVIDQPNIMGLALTGQLEGRPPQVSFAGYLQPTLEAPRSITELLPFMGEPDAQGRYHFRW
jgi:general secretion pathway protein N